MAASSSSEAKLSSEVDDACVACFEALQRYMDAHVMAAELFKRGFIALARARRASNRPGAFSTHFPAEICASTVVRATPVGEDGHTELEVERIAEEERSHRVEPESRTKPLMPAVAGHVPSRGPAIDSFSSMSGNVLTYEDDDGVTHVAHVQSPMSFLPSAMSTVNASMFAALVAQGSADIRADNANRPSTAVSGLKEQVVHAPRLRAPPMQNDPIKWFGVLVPPSLREGQGAFERVMAVLAALANARADLERHSSHFALASAEKARMLASRD